MKSNNGIINSGGGNVDARGAILGQGHVVSGKAEPRERARSCAIGVLTVLAEETRAVIRMLEQHGRVERRVDPETGSWFYEAEPVVDGRRVKTVLLRTQEPGQLPAAIAVQRLLTTYAPSIVALVGIAGGIHPDVRLGDVVIGDEVIYYERRKELADTVRRRNKTHVVPARVRSAIAGFFSFHGEPYTLDIADEAGTARPCVARSGPIGSGEAVIAARLSSIRRDLTLVNDKVLAVETEAGGVSQAIYEELGGRTDVLGWVTVRGVSDYADERKGDDYQAAAAWHAAVIFEKLLEFLNAVHVAAASRS